MGINDYFTNDIINIMDLYYNFTYFCIMKINLMRNLLDIS